MYLPKVFEEHDEAALYGLMEAYPFATIVAGAEIAHVPVLLDRPGRRILAHVGQKNPLAGLARAGAAMTAVFHGPHGYVSPRWYEAPRAQVPTWNYAVVHVEGRAAVLDEGELLALVDRLAQNFEPAEEPWRMGELAPALLAELALAIVGFAIPIERLSGKLKLSQNRSPEDRARVQRALVDRGGADDLAMARLMKPIPEA